jgi:outer membrane protein OmpU
MKKVTKIGASALAGSLVATSAFAGSLSVGGTWEVTGEYVNGSGAAAYKALSNSGNPFGSKANLSFSGSGETDFGTASWFMFTNDAQSGVSSHSVTLDMGDMGLVGFDQGTGAFGVGTIDDKTPTAYEEIWNGTTQTNGDILDANGGSSGVFGYKNTIMGMNLNVEYAPSVASADAGDGAVGGVVTQPDGTSLNFAITNNTMVEGLDFGVGYGETSYDLPSTNVTTGDTESTVGYANYSFGPVTIGTTQSYTSGSVNASGVNIGANEVAIYGVAFNVNDNLSVSYNDYENKFLKRGSQGDVTQDMDGIQIAYTVGGATLRISDASVDNAGGTTGNSEDRTEVSLLMAF